MAINYPAPVVLAVSEFVDLDNGATRRSRSASTSPRTRTATGSTTTPTATAGPPTPTAMPFPPTSRARASRPTPDAFDFDGNDRIGFADVLDLCRRI
ncbi:hypothetical protein [Natrinema salaciae]|uniref:hypothetical protein n=1 Tax=Natrinema salaciae TaxID=1186196 RepID=UPI001113DDDA|nr:hypothetical protein [Natrinema salaciae]